MGQLISLAERRKMRDIKTSRLVVMALCLPDSRERHIACMELHHRAMSGEPVPYPYDARSSTEPPLPSA